MCSKSQSMGICCTQKAQHMALYITYLNLLYPSVHQPIYPSIYLTHHPYIHTSHRFTQPHDIYTHVHTHRYIHSVYEMCCRISGIDCCQFQIVYNYIWYHISYKDSFPPQLVKTLSMVKCYCPDIMRRLSDKCKGGSNVTR